MCGRVTQPTKTIEFKGRQLRYIPGATYQFVAQDIAAALGYQGSGAVTRQVSIEKKAYILVEREVGAPSRMLILDWWVIHRVLLDSSKRVEAARLHDFIIKDILSSAAQRRDNVKSVVAPKVKQYVRPQPLRMEPRKAVEVAPRSVAITEKRSGFNLEFIDNEPAPVASAVSLYGMGRSGPTMSSLEMVEFINEHRKVLASIAMAKFPSKGFAKLEHADFLKKVPDVLGEHAGNFSCMFDVSIANGAVRTRLSF